MGFANNRRHGRRLMNQINVVPYIDVMLVLLVIFMVTAPLMNPGVIELPPISKSSLPPLRPLEVTIRKNMKVSFVDRNVSRAERPIEMDELLSIIKTKQLNNPTQAVVISADKSVSYGKVLEIMDILQQNQVQRIGLLAVPKQ